MKNPMTPAGIEPATFRFVAQHINHCATAVPLCLEYMLTLKFVVTLYIPGNFFNLLVFGIKSIR